MTQYNPLLPNITTVIKKNLPVLHSSHKIPQNFPKNTVNVTYRRNKNLKEFTSPFLFPITVKENNYSIEKCNRSCNICKNSFGVFLGLGVLAHFSTKIKQEKLLKSIKILNYNKFSIFKTNFQVYIIHKKN